MTQDILFVVVLFGLHKASRTEKFINNDECRCLLSVTQVNGDVSLRLIFTSKNESERYVPIYSCNDTWQIMLLKLYIQLDHVIDLILDKIRKDDIRLVAG